MKLSEKEIDDLYRFTRQHFVEHYDVQTELVDHLANDIEEMIQEQPKLTFEQARDRSFKKFGVFGFMEVVESKQKQMSKEYTKLIWSFVKEWFALPKIIMTSFFIMLLYKTIHLPIMNYIVWGAFFIISIYAFVKLRTIKRKLKSKKQKWMLEEMLLTQGVAFAFVLATYPIHMLNLDVNTEASWSSFLMSFIIVLTGIVIYVTLEVIPKKAYELLKVRYPEFK